MRSKWAYKIERAKPPVFSKAQSKAEFINEILNRRGLDGWELVNVIPMPGSGETHLYFKRPF